MLVVVSWPGAQDHGADLREILARQVAGPHVLLDDPAHQVVAGRLLLAADEAHEIVGELARLLRGLSPASAAVRGGRRRTR